MRPVGCESEVMRRLAFMPFLDRLETAAVTGRSRGAVYEAVRRLEREGLVASISHASPLVNPTRRYRLTAAGLHRLARFEGMTVDELLATRPVSEQSRRVLMERLDSVAAIYRLASAISDAAYPIRFRWYRAMPMDAAMTLPDGRTVAVVRQGLTADRTAFSKRLWRLRETFRSGAVLLIVPDEVRLRHARRVVAGSPFLTFLALEEDAVSAGAGAPVWCAPSGSAVPRPSDWPCPTRDREAFCPPKSLRRSRPSPKRLPLDGAGEYPPDWATPLAAQIDREAHPRPSLRLALDISRTPRRAARRETLDALPHPRATPGA